MLLSASTGGGTPAARTYGEPACNATFSVKAEEAAGVAVVAAVAAG